MTGIRLLIIICITVPTPDITLQIADITLDTRYNTADNRHNTLDNRYNTSTHNLSFTGKIEPVDPHKNKGRMTRNLENLWFG